jgi:hypothetical protein
MFNSQKALSFNHITAAQGSNVGSLNVGELVTDFMEEGIVIFKNNHGDNKTITSLSVNTALTKKINQCQLTELLEFARTQSVFELTKAMRDLLKKEAAAQIQAALTA